MKYALVNKPNKKSHLPYRNNIGEIIKIYKSTDETIYTLKFGDIEEYFSEKEIKISDDIDYTKIHIKKNIKREDFPSEVPVIPQGYGKEKNNINNSLLYSNLGVDFEPLAYYFSNSNLYDISLYNEGFCFRTYEEAKRNKFKVQDSLYKKFEKQKDWANIERKIFNNNNLKSGNLEYIKFSKFFKNRFYYKICIDPEFETFYIKKMNIGNGNSYLTCFDYATENFFLTKSEAKNSKMYKKMKTFFKLSNGYHS